MKKIEAIVRPALFSRVVDSLREIPEIPGIIIYEIKGFGKTRARTAKDKFTEEFIDYIPRMKLEVVVKDEQVEEVKALILKKAHTGNTGDGKIFISHVEDCIKIRTFERGDAAI
ncbi:MAG: P-II family nitrogen regulator [bacterium]